ncbi:MFS transporter [Pseudolysinimonas sp.]|uniref:MFS transporter n=1 Tax=Pseudolysinimonas sp. TaxID=2680009 RepID=UPI003F815DBF
MSDSSSIAPVSPRRWWTLAVVALAQLMVVLDSTVVNIALPAAQHDLGFSDGSRQWIITAYSLAFGSLLLLGGRISDLIGRKRAFLIGLVGFALASALGGAAPDLGLLVAARALQGAFGALLAPTALAVLATTFTVPRERSRAFGVFGALAGAGGAIGLLLGGYLTEYVGWRWNLYINVAIALVAVVGAIVLVPTIARSGPRPRLDIPGTVLVSGGLFALVYGFSNAETDSWSSPLTWGMLVAAGVLLIAFVLWQRRAAHPLLPLAIVLDRTRAAAYFSILLAGVAMFGIFLFITYYLEVNLGFSPMSTGLAFLPMIGMLVLAAQVGNNLLVPRFGAKVLVPIGMGLGALGMLLLTRLDAHSTYAGGVLPSLLILGTAMGTIMPSSFQSATLRLDPRFAGVGSAMTNTSQQVGGSIGTALLNTLVATAATDYVGSHLPATPAVAAAAAVHGYTVAFWVCAGVFVLGGVLSGTLYRRHRHALGRMPTAAIATQEPAIAH